MFICYLIINYWMRRFKLTKSRLAITWPKPPKVAIPRALQGLMFMEFYSDCSGKVAMLILKNACYIPSFNRDWRRASFDVITGRVLALPMLYRSLHTSATWSVHSVYSFCRLACSFVYTSCICMWLCLD